MESHTDRRTAGLRAEAVRGLVMMMGLGVDIPSEALALKRRMETGEQGELAPIEAAMFSCLMAAQAQLVEMMQEQDRVDLPVETQELVLADLVQQFAEDFVMLDGGGNCN